MDQRIGRLLGAGAAAARAGHRTVARSVFREVLSLDPANVPAMLWMSWLSEDPHISLDYAERALTVDPGNARARAARQWAQSRLSPPVPSRRSSPEAGPPEDDRQRRPLLPLMALGSLAALVVAMILILLWGSAREPPLLAPLPAPSSPTPALTSAPGRAATSAATTDATASGRPTTIPTATPNADISARPTARGTEPPPTSTGTSTPTATDNPDPTREPSQAPRPTSTTRVTPSASATPGLAVPSPSPTLARPSPTEVSAGGRERWIDVDLTLQKVTAYEGQTPVRVTLASTGLPNTPTPVGRYQIYVKYTQADMRGPGYYLPNVPYAMYFYRGYGIHGTYWHDNFGHPMSHGCINLPTEEAEWFFRWASVGTLVNIHW